MESVRVRGVRVWQSVGKNGARRIKYLMMRAEDQFAPAL